MLVVAAATVLDSMLFDYQDYIYVYLYSENIHLITLIFLKIRRLIKISSTNYAYRASMTSTICCMIHLDKLSLEVAYE